MDKPATDGAWRGLSNAEPGLSREPSLSNMARIKLSLGPRGLEVEGDEEFVREMLDRYEALLDPASSAAGDTPSDPGRGDGADLGSFGEFIQKLPSSATEVDRMLAAGFWVQRRSADDAFATAEASRRLAEQGIKLGNPSQCVRQSLAARRVFAVQRGRFRVSQTGRQHLRQLVGGEIIPE